MTHWKKLTNPNYLGAYSIENGQDLILTIKSVKNEIVMGADGKKEECTICYFKENAKPMILNSTNMKMITKLYKTPYIEEWSDKQIQIGTEKVKAFGEVVDALRIRNKLPKPIANLPAPKCADCVQDITGANGMTPEQVAAYTSKKYGKPLCSACATKSAEKLKAEAVQDAAE